MPKTNMQ